MNGSNGAPFSETHPNGRRHVHVDAVVVDEAGQKRLAGSIDALLHVTPPFQHRHPVAIELAKRLVEMASVAMSKVFFTSSGSEANDTAVKLLRYCNVGRGRPEKTKIISQRQGYHGTTMVTGSMTGLPHS